MRLWDLQILVVMISAGVVWVTLGTAGCAHKSVTQLPPSAWGGAMDEGEEEACENQQCQTFTAPCNLLESAQTRVTSSLEDQYRERVEAYRAIGYCLRSARPLPLSDYAKGTCLFTLVRGVEGCH